MSLVGSARRCPACAGPLSEPDLGCPRCGPASLSSPTATASTHVRAGSSVRRQPDGGRYDAGDGARGALPIAGLLGQGGMGEVYRADDLKLGQAVALKFLPEGSRATGARWRGCNERGPHLARQISHPNVCRVYDISERTAALPLHGVRRRRGPRARSCGGSGASRPDKAPEIIRQLCAGLAAAHERVFSTATSSPRT